MGNQNDAVKKSVWNAGDLFDGKKIAAAKVIGDLLLIWSEGPILQAYQAEKSTLNKPVPYQLDKHPVNLVYAPKDQAFLILGTELGWYLRDLQNRAIENYEDWADAFYEPYSQQFFRKSTADHWIDMDNHLLPSTIFITGNVLISLNAKKSIQSYGFLNQSPLVSKNEQLIQLGKVVYDADLNIQYFFRQKIAGLNNKTVQLGAAGEVVEVVLGLEQTAFIWEHNKRPLLCHNKPIYKYIGSFHGKSNSFEQFHNGEQVVTWNVATGAFVLFKEQPIALDFSSYININDREYILGEQFGKSFYIDLQTNEEFSPASLPSNEAIIFIDSAPIKLNNQKNWNARTENRAFVLTESNHDLLKLPNGQEPETLFEVPGLKRLLAGYSLEETDRILWKKDLSLLQLGLAKVEVSAITYQAQQKLYNGLDTQKQPLVLDARRGMDEVSLAYSNESKVMAVLGEPQAVGRSIWQNAKLETLGGSTPAVININDPDLAPCLLPANMMAISDSEEPSIFHSSAIISIDFKQSISIGAHLFFPAVILSLKQRPVTILINKFTGRPLQLQGSSYKNELVTGCATDTTIHHFGPYELIKVNTLTEEFEESALLCAIDSLSSTLLFNDSFLPPLKHVVQLEEATNWPYQLFEICAVTAEKEFLVLEKVAPHRILVEKKNKAEQPKIIQSTKKALKEPEEISSLKKLFFEDPGYLRKVE